MWKRGKLLHMYVVWQMVGVMHRNVGSMHFFTVFMVLHICVGTPSSWRTLAMAWSDDPSLSAFTVGFCRVGSHCHGNTDIHSQSMLHQHTETPELFLAKHEAHLPFA